MDESEALLPAPSEFPEAGSAALDSGSQIALDSTIKHSVIESSGNVTCLGQTCALDRIANFVEVPASIEAPRSTG